MKYTIAILFYLNVFTINAQSIIYDTLPYAVAHYNARLSIFKEESIVKNNIIFLGNSITEFGDWRKLLNNPSICNRGIAGDITFGVLNRLDDIIIRKPSKLIIEIGINDISKNIPEEVIAKNIFTIIKRIKAKSPKTVLVVTSILPTNDSVKMNYPDAFNKNTNAKKVNKILKKEAIKVGYNYIDLYKVFSDGEGKLKIEYADKDGLHINQKGYKKWISILKITKQLHHP